MPRPIAKKKGPNRGRKRGFPWIRASIALVLLAGLAGLAVLWWSRGRLGLAGSGSPPVGSPAQAVPSRTTAVGAPLPNGSPAASTAPKETTTSSSVRVATNRLQRIPVADPAEPFEPRNVTNLLEAQIVLAGLGISAGPMDGNSGAQTAAALRAYQMQNGLEQTGWLDRPTREALRLTARPWTTFTVTSEDLARLAPIPSTWLGKSQAPALGHETLLELVAERTLSHPALVRRLNPDFDWGQARPGDVLTVANPQPVPARRPSLVRVSLSGRHLRAFDGSGNLLAHFPCSIARKVDKRPVGDLHVVVAVADPDYTFDPEVFPESAEARSLGRKLRLPPGPNNPVGTAWIGLDRPGYGIHGTPKPEDVGRTESHGCFRLANWNADLLRRMAWVGLPIRVEP